SMTSATWRGTSCDGMAGGRAPLGCGGGGRGTGPPYGGPEASTGRGTPLDQGKGAQLALHVPLQVGGDEAGGVAAGDGGGRVRDVPLPVQQGVEQHERLPRRRDGAGRATTRAHRSPGRDVERRMWAGLGAPGAVVDR